LIKTSDNTEVSISAFNYDTQRICYSIAEINATRIVCRSNMYACDWCIGFFLVMWGKKGVTGICFDIFCCLWNIYDMYYRNL